ncbi:MAG: hypothetical protein Q4B58_08185, partial [Bacteroidales bacterium]|nr:hypothetical protein [Bacteroidales bacterium]
TLREDIAMFTTLVATIGYMPLKSEIFHSIIKYYDLFCSKDFPFLNRMPGHKVARHLFFDSNK